MAVGPWAEKFNIVSSYHGRTQKMWFSVLDRKYLFGENLLQKIQNCQFMLKFGSSTDGVHFLCFWLEISFLGKFGPKNQNYKFKQKFGTETN